MSRGTAGSWLVQQLPPLVSLCRLVSTGSALVFADSARVGPLVSLRSSPTGLTSPAGLGWFSLGLATSLALRWSLLIQLGSGHWSRFAAHPLVSPRRLVSAGSAWAAPLASLRTGLCCVRLLHSSVSWWLVRRSRALVSAAHFLSAARSPARANSTGIRLLLSVPHLWPKSFECPASHVKKNQAHLLNIEPHSWFCVSDLLTLI